MTDSWIYWRVAIVVDRRMYELRETFTQEQAQVLKDRLVQLGYEAKAYEVDGGPP